ncbi:MAG: alpha/beta fold hydrolase [Cyanobacteria bacterium P01_A01_bin.123]
MRFSVQFNPINLVQRQSWRFFQSKASQPDRQNSPEQTALSYFQTQNWRFACGENASSQPARGLEQPTLKQSVEPGRRLFPAFKWASALMLGGIIWLGISPSAAALERLRVRVGPITQILELSDLETFAQTGEVPSRLQIYSTLLTPEIRAMLQNRLALDPAVGDRIIDDILDSPNGELLLDTLASITPDVSMEQLRQAVQDAAQNETGFNVLALLRAIPEDTVEIDLSAAIALISQLNLSRFESQALSRVLEAELEPAAAETFTAPFDPTQPGTETVNLWEIQMRDFDRDRTIPVDVYWSDNTRGPLVMISHGFGADRRFLAYLAQHIASHGFTVVALEHPGSNVEALVGTPLDPRASQEPSRILPATEFLDRPRDATFVLDELARLNQHSLSLRGKLNTENVSFMGHSLGGYTGLALAGAQLDLSQLQTFCANLVPVGLSPADWLQCAAVELPQTVTDLSDRRIQQVVAMNPLTGALFGPAGLSAVTIPTLILTSTNDSVTPIVDQQLRPFDQLTGQKYLVAVIGGTHLSVGDPNNLNPALSQVPFMPELRGEETASLRRYLQGTLLSFVQQQTDKAEAYSTFLTPGYAQHLSTELLPIRLTTEVPSSMTDWLQVSRSGANEPRSSFGTLASTLHLGSINVRHRVGRLQRYALAYLRLNTSSLIVFHVPMRFPRQG